MFYVGPALPKTLFFHEIVRIGLDLLVLGGVLGGGSINPDGIRNYSEALFKLSCTNNECEWEKLPQNLTIPRSEFVAIPVPDDFITCN